MLAAYCWPPVFGDVDGPAERDIAAFLPQPAREAQPGCACKRAQRPTADRCASAMLARMAFPLLNPPPVNYIISGS
jgi:hypothetical protein